MRKQRSYSDPGSQASTPKDLAQDHNCERAFVHAGTFVFTNRCVEFRTGIHSVSFVVSDERGCKVQLVPTQVGMSLQAELAIRGQ